MLKTKLLCVILLSFVCGLMCANPRMTISGIVVDENNELLVGANVYLDGTTCGTATDAEGYFVLKDVLVGSYQLSASYSGYKKYRQDIANISDVKHIVIVMEKAPGALGEIVVTGTGTPHHVKIAPVPTELYTSKEIERIGASSIDGLLGALSSSFDFTPGNTGTNIQLNGLGSEYVAVLVDGKRLAGSVSNQSDLSRINVADIEKIEVVKGASSSLYGSDAIGGVINIITKKRRQKINFVNNSYVGSYGVLNQDNTFSFNLGKLSGKTHYGYRQSDGWMNTPYETDGDSLVATDEMTINAFTSKNMAQSLAYNVTQKLSVSGSVSAYAKDQTLPTTVKKYGYSNEDFAYSLGAAYLLNKTDKLTLDFNSDRFTYIYEYNQDYSDYTEGQRVEQHQQGRDDLNLKWVTRLSKNNTLIVGGEYLSEVYRSESKVEGGEVNNYTASLYAQDEMTFFNKLDLVAGLRMSYHQEFGAMITPKLSALYKMDHFNARATYSRGFKAPTLKELYYRYESGSKLYLGYDELQAQKSNYYNVGVDYHNSMISCNVSAYINDVDGLIEYETIETTEEDALNGISTTKQQHNVGYARSKGVDVNLRLNLPLGFTLGAGYSYVDARNLDTDESLEYVANNYLNANLNYGHSWKRYDLNVNLLARVSDEKYYNDGPAPAYQIYKLATSHSFEPVGIVQFSATAGIDNLLDYVDTTPKDFNPGTTSPGRTFFVGVKINFTK